MRIVAVITDPAVITRIPSCTGPGASNAPANPGARPRANAVAHSSQRPDPGPLGVPAAHHRPRAAHFSAPPHPPPDPNTPDSLGFRPRPATHCVIDPPTPLPDIRIETKGIPHKTERRCWAS